MSSDNYHPILEMLLGRLYSDPWPIGFKEQKILGNEIYAASGIRTPVPEPVLTAKKTFMKSLRSGIIPIWIAANDELLHKYKVVMKKVPNCEKSYPPSKAAAVKREVQKPKIEEPKRKKARFSTPSIAKTVVPKLSSEEFIQQIFSNFEKKLNIIEHKLTKLEIKRGWQAEKEYRLGNITAVEELRKKDANLKHYLEQLKMAKRQQTAVLKIKDETRRKNEMLIDTNLVTIHHLQTIVASKKNGFTDKTTACHSSSEETAH